MQHAYLLSGMISLFLAMARTDAQPVGDAPRVPPTAKESAVLKELTVEDADELVQELSKLFPPMPGRRIWATDATSLSVYATKADQTKIAAAIERLDREDDSDRPGDVPVPPAQEEPRPGEKLPPVKVTAYGNRLIVSSEDPEALEVITGLARMLTHAQPGEGDFEVIQLRNASAPDVAKILDEIYNGKVEPAKGSDRGRGGRGLPGMMLGALGLSGGGGGTRIEKVRIVADPAANTLIVKAAPLDLLSIQGFVESLDRGPDDDVAAVKRTHVIGPLRNAQATEVANILKEVYKDALAGTRSTPTTSPLVSALMGGRGRRSGRGAVANTSPTGPALLSIGADEKTNTIILSAPMALYEDIEEVVADLDVEAGKANTVVEVLPVENVSPAAVEQLLQALQQSATTSRTTTRGAATRTGSRGSSTSRGGR